jgi:hypothetical protein
MHWCLVVTQLLDSFLCSAVSKFVSPAMLSSVFESYVSLHLEVGDCGTVAPASAALLRHIVTAASQPHASVILRNRSLRCIEQLVSTCFGRLSELVTPGAAASPELEVLADDGGQSSHGVDRPLHPHSASGAAGGAGAAASAAMLDVASEPYDVYSLAALLRKCVGLMTKGRVDGSGALGLHLLHTAVVGAGASVVHPAAAPIAEVLRHDAALHILWLGSRSVGGAPRSLTVWLCAVLCCALLCFVVFCCAVRCRTRRMSSPM